MLILIYYEPFGVRVNQPIFRYHCLMTVLCIILVKTHQNVSFAAFLGLLLFVTIVWTVYDTNIQMTCWSMEKMMSKWIHTKKLNVASAQLLLSFQTLEMKRTLRFLGLCAAPEHGTGTGSWYVARTAASLWLRSHWERGVNGTLFSASEWWMCCFFHTTSSEVVAACGLWLGCVCFSVRCWWKLFSAPLWCLFILVARRGGIICPVYVTQLCMSYVWITEGPLCFLLLSCWVRW